LARNLSKFVGVADIRVEDAQYSVHYIMNTGKSFSSITSFRKDEIEEHLQNVCEAYAWRDHKGNGLPNFVIPIKLWDETIIGHVYAGQFLVKPLPLPEKDELIMQLRTPFFSCRKYREFDC